MTGGILDRGCSHFQALVNKPFKIVAPCVELRLYAWELEHKQGSYIKLIGDYAAAAAYFRSKFIPDLSVTSPAFSRNCVIKRIFQNIYLPNTLSCQYKNNKKA